VLSSGKKRSLARTSVGYLLDRRGSSVRGIGVLLGRKRGAWLLVEPAGIHGFTCHTDDTGQSAVRDPPADFRIVGDVKRAGDSAPATGEGTPSSTIE